MASRDRFPHSASRAAAVLSPILLVVLASCSESERLPDHMLAACKGCFDDRFFTTPADEDEVASSIAAGRRVAMDVQAAFSDGVTADALNSRIPSAVLLVGPDDSAHGYHRLQLATDLDRYINGVIQASLERMALESESDINDLPHFTRQAEPAPLNRLKTLEVRFPDLTTIAVELAEIGLPFAPGDSARFGFDILAESARLPDGRPVPQSKRQLVNFDLRGLEGESDVTRHLTELAVVFDEAGRRAVN